MDSDTSRVRLSLLLVLFSLLALSSCGRGFASEKQYGSDRNYFLALIALDSGDTGRAKKLLSSSAKSKDSLIARRSKETLISLSYGEKKSSLISSLVKEYQDDSSLSFACTQFLSQNEWARIISLTNTIDLSSCPNSIALARLTSLKNKNDPRFAAEYFRWCTTRAYTQSHEELTAQLREVPEEIALRSLVYQRKYSLALEPLMLIAQKKPAGIPPQLVSDLGKCFLYGSQDFLKGAAFMASLSQSLNAQGKFHALFYSGRLYEKAGANQERASSGLKNAFLCASSAEQSDNALWYFFKSELRISSARAISSLRNYAPSISDPYYYDDFFDELSQKLISEHAWSLYYEAALVCSKYASSETAAKFCYVAARLIQLSLVNVGKEQCTELFSRALSSGSEWYYRALSAGELSLGAEETDEVFCRFGNRRTCSGDADRILSGYADFNLTERIYPEWLRLRNEASVDCAEKIALHLQANGSEQNAYFTQSLRIASWHAAHPDKNLGKRMLMLVYPRDFSSLVQMVCAEFGVPEHEFYALVRSESFFDPLVKSTAQAQGLSQLMEATAKDIARKLKVSDYSLSDAYTNLRFGAFYFAELKGRLDGSTLLSLFSYNAGITRVRSWLRQSEREMGFQNPPLDLFLESLPFAETREYGRKNVSAAVMYAALYEDVPPSLTIDSLLH